MDSASANEREKRDRIRRALKAAVLDLEEIAETTERALRRANEKLRAIEIEDKNDDDLAEPR